MKKKNIAVTATAIALAVVLVLGGGTYAYLSGSTEEVENEFTTNQNGVDLEETTEGYEIVPGTSQDKDPTVTATYTLDSYVFVEVTDATDGLVTWYMENGWTYLSETKDDETGATTYIYYQLLEYNEESANENGVCTSVLSVLEGDKVYYSATLTNKDMEDAEDISLTFQAYIIQADPFADAENAWKVLSAQTEEDDGTVTYPDGYTVDLTTGYVYESVAAAISAANDGDVIYLLADSSVSVSDLTTSKDLMFDLNGNTLSTSDTGTIAVTSDLTITNGSLTLNNATGTGSTMTVESNATLTLDGVTVTETAGISILTKQSEKLENATLIIKDSTISSRGYYAVATNASGSSSGVEIIIENSTITVSSPDDNGDSCAVLVNIDAAVTITGSNITGERQGVVLRGSTATISDTTITTTATYSNTTQYQDTTWNDGNEVPMAALVVGNVRSGSYAYATDGTLSNVTLVVEKNTSTVPAIYAGSSAYNTTITGASDSDTILVRNTGTATITVNGTAVANTTELTKVGELEAATTSTDTDADYPKTQT